MRRILFSALLALVTLSRPAYAGLNVFACEPEWGALVQELGGDKVDIYVATTGQQDPHQIQARPSLIAKARAADLTVCSGSELEVGWLPMIVRQAANAKIDPGAPGSFEAASYVRMLEVPARVDRSEGDVHPGGNPHIQTDPRNIAAVAVPLAQRMIELDPADTAYFNARYTDFATRWNAAMVKWETETAPLKGIPVAVQHKNWVYLFDWLGLQEVVSLEPKPGVPPSSGYLAQVLEEVQRRPVKMVIRAAYEDSRPSEFLAERAKIPAVELPFTVGGTDQAKDLFGLYDDTIQRLLAGLKP
ncbi:MAG: zinc ABC transporter substrate-binding protein [Alphaproteobacteria bacterium]